MKVAAYILAVSSAMMCALYAFLAITEQGKYPAADAITAIVWAVTAAGFASLGRRSS